MQQQLDIELTSLNWGNISHERLVEWLKSLSNTDENIRVSKRKTELATKYIVTYYDFNKKEYLGFIFILTDFNHTHMIRYIGGVPDGAVQKKVTEDDLLSAQIWLSKIINRKG